MTHANDEGCHDQKRLTAEQTKYAEMENGLPYVGEVIRYYLTQIGSARLSGKIVNQGIWTCASASVGHPRG